MKAIIAYSSLTGNTETCAEWIRDFLEEDGHLVRLEDAANIYPEVVSDYDLVILGTPTYWGGEPTEEFNQFLDEMDRLDLSGQNVAVFGLGDEEGYPMEFCRAVDTVEKHLQKVGAHQVCESLRIDGDPMLQKSVIQEWVRGLLKQAEA